MDRYIYDELANLPLSRAMTKIFIRIVDFLVPRPDVAYLLDAEPEVARARKPEYPVEFLHTNRRAYLELARMLGRMTIIPPLPLPQATVEVERALAAVLNADNEPAATLTPSTGCARGVWQGRNRS